MLGNRLLAHHVQVLTVEKEEGNFNIIIIFITIIIIIIPINFHGCDHHSHLILDYRPHVQKARMHKNPQYDIRDLTMKICNASCQVSNLSRLLPLLVLQKLISWFRNNY